LKRFYYTRHGGSAQGASKPEDKLFRVMFRSCQSKIFSENRCPLFGIML
jgi:hypothetical protein